MFSSEAGIRPDFVPTSSHEKQRTRIESGFYLHRLSQLGISATDDQIEKIIGNRNDLEVADVNEQLIGLPPPQKKIHKKKKKGFFSWLVGSNEPRHVIKRRKEDVEDEITPPQPVDIKIGQSDITASHWAPASSNSPSPQPALSLPGGAVDKKPEFQCGCIVVADVGDAARQATVEGYNSSTSSYTLRFSDGRTATYISDRIRRLVT
eukprot:TRINITY_DN14524_c0_g1_i1.p1 TRINITY_DN14524_c0_g1~~TRINITY_DN14524_c0_g1_i1.p1  ORF type:complete len:207 (+),score=34.22 TRINITY_DN14524_c0_g1_i1:49-669(+)